MSDAASPDAKPLPLSIVLPFSAVSFPLNALGIAVFVYLAPYLASHLGVSLTVIGTAWLVVRLLDVGVDLTLGAVMDRTRTRIGRYRVWLLIGAPILMLALFRLFMAPQGIGMSYLVVWLLIMYLGTSILTLAHLGWGARLATHYDQRARLFGVIAAVGVTGAVAVLLSPILAKNFGFTDAQGVQGMGWFVILATPLAVALVTVRTPESIAPDVGRPRASLEGLRMAARDFLSVIAKPDLVRLFLAQVSLTLGPGWMSALYLFFFGSSRGFNVQQSSILLLLYILAGVAGALASGWLAPRITKHRTLMVTTTAYSLGLCTVMMIPKGNLLAAVPVMCWCGFMAAGFDLMVRAMLADVGDEVRLEQGRERISLIYAMNGLATKIAAAFCLYFTYPLIERLGYNPKEGAVNTVEAIHHLELAFLIGPIVFVMLGGACVIGWRLDAVRHGAIRAQLEARDAAYAEAPIIESVSAQPSAVVAPEA